MFKTTSSLEQALENLEDTLDLEAYHERRHEETIALEDILALQKKKKIREI